MPAFEMRTFSPSSTQPSPSRRARGRDRRDVAAGLGLGQRERRDRARRARTPAISARWASSPASRIGCVPRPWTAKIESARGDAQPQHLARQAQRADVDPAVGGRDDREQAAGGRARAPPRDRGSTRRRPPRTARSPAPPRAGAPRRPRAPARRTSAGRRSTARASVTASSYTFSGAPANRGFAPALNASCAVAKSGCCMHIAWASRLGLDRLGQRHRRLALDHLLGHRVRERRARRELVGPRPRERDRRRRRRRRPG